MSDFDAFRRSDAFVQIRAEVESRLFEQLDYLDDKVPQCVVDLALGTESAALALKQRWPKANVLAVDADAAALKTAKRQTGLFRQLLGRDVQRIGAEARALPLTDASVDVLFANLSLHDHADLPAAFAGIRRVLKPDGLLLASSFIDIAVLGDALMAAGFRDPVLERDTFEVEGGIVEVASAQAWAPQPGTPIRELGHDVVAIPLAKIPVRRKQ